MTSQEPEIRALDLFAGVGGSSLGAVRAGVTVVAAVDNWDVAEKTYLDNFGDVEFFCRKCEGLSLAKLAKRIGPIQLLIASPECTSHTCAKGSAKKSEKSRETAMQVIRFARAFKPRWIVVENVIQMRRWRRYEEWLERLIDLGYHHREQVLNSADFGVPQSRKRLFNTFDLKTQPPLISCSRSKRIAAQHVIDPNGHYGFSALRAEGRARPTLERANRAINLLGRKAQFLLVYYGSDGAGGWQEVSKPLRTVTTVDRFAYVRPGTHGEHEMRMLQVPELKLAMGFPSTFRLEHSTRRDKIKLLGNAVCPPVLEAIIRDLIN
jgi:DNA (cytosine-5)-methyltransferase 1